MQPIVQAGASGLDAARNDEGRRTHEALLLEAMAEGRVTSVAPHTVSEEYPDAANATNHLLVLGPVNVLSSDTTTERGATIAVIELRIRGDASPATYRGCEQFLTAVCELAADYHAFHELRRLRQDEHHHTELLRSAGWCTASWTCPPRRMP